MLFSAVSDNDDFTKMIDSYTAVQKLFYFFISRLEL